MILTKNEKLIRAYIEDKTVIDGLMDGRIAEDLKLDEMFYFFKAGVGIFPATLKDNTMSMHAAIPKDNRGMKAIEAATELAKFLKSQGYEVIAQQLKNKPHLKRFIKMVGFTHDHDTDKYHVYRYE